MPVWILENYRAQGLTDEEILETFDYLTAEDLAAAWEYADSP